MQRQCRHFFVVLFRVLFVFINSRIIRKRVVLVIVVGLAVLLIRQFFKGVESYARRSSENMHRQINAVRELESSLGERNRQLDGFFNAGTNPDVATVVREFRRECLNWESGNRRSNAGDSTVPTREPEPSPALQLILDCLVESDEPDVIRELHQLIETGRAAESYWAARAAARRQELPFFDSIWKRVSAPKGTPVDLRDRLCRLAAEFSRDYSGRILAEQLKSSDYMIRDAACRMLASCPSGDAVPALCELLDTSSMSERDVVVQALLAMGSDVIPELSAIALGKRSNARDAALLALSRIPDRQALKLAFDAGLLESALLKNRSLAGSIDESRRMVLGKGGNQDVSEIETTRNLLNAIYAMLCDELNSPHENVRFAAVELMGKIPVPEATGRVRKVVDSDRSEKVRAAAMRSLQFSSDPAAVESALKNIVSTDDKLRGAASDVIVRNLDDSLIERLMPAVNHQNPDVRSTAMWLLGRLGSEKARSILIENKDDSDITVVRRVCFQLESMNLVESDISWLRELCRNQDVSVRNTVSKMLGKLDTYDARTLLIEMVKSDVPGKSFEILGKSDDPRVFWPLFERQVKSKFIRKIGGPDALRKMAADHWKELIPLLDSRERSRRSLAAALLEKVDVQPVRLELRRRILAGDRNVMVHGSEGFVMQSDDEVVKILKEIIVNDEDIASDLAFRYYDSSNPLTKATHKWLTDHHYQIITFMVPVTGKSH